jgi:hypothetical protein
MYDYVTEIMPFNKYNMIQMYNFTPGLQPYTCIKVLLRVNTNTFNITEMNCTVKTIHFAE